MPLFEVDARRSTLVQPLAPADSGFAEHAGSVVDDHVARLLGEQVFPVVQRAPGVRPEDAPHLLALDASGQPVVIEMVSRLDPGTLATALAHAGRAARLSRADVADRYPEGPRAFERAFAAFRDATPIAKTRGQHEGSRLLLLCAQVDPALGDALEFLRLTATAISVLRLGVVTGPDGRRLVEVEPLQGSAARRARGAGNGGADKGEATGAPERGTGPEAQPDGSARGPRRTTTLSPTSESPAATSATPAVPAPPAPLPPVPPAATVPAREPATGREQAPERPVAEPVGQPVAEPAGRPVADPVAGPAGQPVDEPAGQPVDEPAGQPVDEPAGRPVGEAGAAPRPGAPAGRPVAFVPRTAESSSALPMRSRSARRRESSSPGGTALGGTTPGGPASDEHLTDRFDVAGLRGPSPISAPAPRTPEPSVPDLPTVGDEDPDLSMLAAHLARPTSLVWARPRRGQHFEAVLLPTGQIELPGKGRYRNPDAAATAAIGAHREDGWDVWRVGDNGPSLTEVFREQFA